MRKKLCLAIALVTILSIMVFTVSCTKKMVQTQPSSISEPIVQRVPDRSSNEAEQDGRLLERLREEAAAREAEETVFVNENVHFAFNSYNLSDQAQRILNSKADYLHMNPDITITIEGHCDDRGTNNYNLALGGQRAVSVKKFLIATGIDPTRLDTVSYGEERPIAMGHDEVSWAKNRRAQFLIN